MTAEDLDKDLEGYHAVSRLYSRPERGCTRRIKSGLYSSPLPLLLLLRRPHLLMLMWRWPR